MIEAILLFSLGFLTAAFLAFLVAPAIQRRIVKFTENRLKATLPISQQELKAQKDMVRAQYAAENAKLNQAVVSERQRSVDALTRLEKVAAASKTLAAEKADLETIRQDMEEKIRELGSALRGEETEILGMRAELAAARFTMSEDAAKITDITERLAYLGEMLDSNRIELAARDTELASARTSFNSFMAERDKARESERVADERAAAAEARLSREVNKVMRLQDKLDRELAANARRDNALSRRADEITRLKERLKVANAQARQAVRALKDAGITLQLEVQDEPEAEPDDFEEDVYDEPEMEAVEAPVIDSPLDAHALVAELHAAEGSVSSALLDNPTPEDEAHLREDIASIAARMVALTAAREGENSPLRKVLSDEGGKRDGGRQSLGERAAHLIERGTV